MAGHRDRRRRDADAEAGAGLAWTGPARGLTAELAARGLLTHADRGFRERGLAGRLVWDPRPGSDHGPTLTLSQTMGASATGGMAALLGDDAPARFVTNDERSSGALERRRLDLDLDYGIDAFGGRFTVTPEMGLGFSDRHREYRLGWRLGLVRGAPGSFDLGLTRTWRETGDVGTKPEDAFHLRAQVRW